MIKRWIDNGFSNFGRTQHAGSAMDYGPRQQHGSDNVCGRSGLAGGGCVSAEDLDGAIYLIHYSGEACVRRLLDAALGGIQLVPENRAEFREQRLTALQAMGVTMIGRVSAAKAP